MSDIVMEGIRKSFGTHEIIRGVDMNIRSGEFIVFVGPSGCGKSTLLRLVAGLEEITDGVLRIGGKIVNDSPPAERGLTMVFQSYALYPHMSAYENMAFGLRQSGAKSREIDESVREAARVLHIEELLDRKPKQLSGGQRQRVAIGRAIVRKPSVFLFDEPLSNLDASLRVQMRLEIARLHKQLATTMIYVTHDQAEAMTLADRIVVLRLGMVEQTGSPLELYHRPANSFVAGFIGSPKMNFIPGTIDRVDGEGVSVRLRGCGESVRALVEAFGTDEGCAVELGIRPEHVTLANGGAGLPGRVEFVEQLGDSQYAYVRLPGETLLTVRVDSAVSINENGQVRVVLPPADCHLFRADAGGASFARRVDANVAAQPVLGQL